MGKTVEEIAAELGTSVTTVRLVLLGKARQYRISRKTEERVKNYTEEHGYLINHTARSLRLQRSDTLALIVPRLSNHFFASLAEKLEIRCRDAGLQLLISCCYDSFDTQRQLIQNFRQRNIDGLFMVPANADILPEAVKQFSERTVLLDRDFGAKDFPLVLTDNEVCGYEMTRKLLAYQAQQSEPQDLLFLAGKPETPSIAARLKGFRTALDQLKYPAEKVKIRHTQHNDFNEGVAMMSAFLDEGSALPSILMSSSIPLFEGALFALREKLGDVPVSMILGTFDDHTMLDFLPNPLCSARQDSAHLVNAAFAEMEKLIAGEHEPRTHVAALKIIVRNMDK